jgi:hypothetical protein
VDNLASFLRGPKRDCLQVLSLKSLAAPSFNKLTLPSLVELELHACGLQATDVHTLCSALPHLTSLDVSSNPFPDHALTKLAECKELVALNLSVCEALSDMCLQHLAHNNLRVLSVAGVKQLSDASLLNLRRIASLEALNLSNLPKVTDIGILSVGDLPLLQILDVSATNITALSLLSRLSSLLLLCVLRCPLLPYDIVLNHMPSETRTVMERHVFGDNNPWLKQASSFEGQMIAEPWPNN